MNPKSDRAPRLAPTFLALSCVGLLSAPAFASAQDQGTASQGPRLGSMTVTDTAIDEEGYKVDAPSSPKYTAPLLDTPKSISIIPSQLIRDTASASLVEALRTVPGITLGAGEGGNPLGDRPFIRGFDSQASTYLDGVRDVGAQSREIFAIEQIEVVKGSDSSMGGRGNAGGSINLVSKVPTADRFIAASAAAGNADYKRATLDINQPINDFVGVRLAAMWHDQDVAGRDALFQKRWGVAPSIKLGLTGPTSLTVSYYHLETDELPDSGIPYLYTISNAPAGVTETGPARRFTNPAGQSFSVPRGAYYGLADRDFRKTNVNNLTARFEHDFGGVKLRNTTRYGSSSQGYLWTQPDDSQGNVLNGLVWRRANSRYSKTWGLLNQTDLSGEFEIGGVRNSFAASVEFSQEVAHNGNYVSNAATGTAVQTGSSAVGGRCGPASTARFNCTSLVNPNPYDPWVSYASDASNTVSPIVRSAGKTWTRSATSTKAASFFDTIHFSDALLLNIGGRYDRYETRVTPGLAATVTTGGRPTFRRNDDLWTYNVGLVFKPAENGSLYISTATAATPPGSFIANGTESNALNVTSQALTDALKVEKTRSYEVGTKWNLLGDSLALTLAAFRTETKNARVTDAFGVVDFIGERRIEGIEFSFNGNITPDWSIFGGYTFMDSKVVDGGFTATTVGGVTRFAPAAATGRWFPNTPRHSGTLFTTYKVTPALSVGGGAIYMGKVYGGYADSRTIANDAVVITKQLARFAPSYWRFDANAAINLTDAIQFQVNVLNVANKRYYDKAFASHYASQAPGRTAIATLNIKY